MASPGSHRDVCNCAMLFSGPGGPMAEQHLVVPCPHMLRSSVHGEGLHPGTGQSQAGPRRAEGESVNLSLLSGTAVSTGSAPLRHCITCVHCTWSTAGCSTSPCHLLSIPRDLAVLRRSRHPSWHGSGVPWGFGLCVPPAPHSARGHRHHLHPDGTASLPPPGSHRCPGWGHGGVPGGSGWGGGVRLPLCLSAEPSMCQLISRQMLLMDLLLFLVS